MKFEALWKARKETFEKHLQEEDVGQACVAWSDALDDLLDWKCGEPKMRKKETGKFTI